jgi:hypothetical protein
VFHFFDIICGEYKRFQPQDQLVSNGRSRSRGAVILTMEPDQGSLFREGQAWRKFQAGILLGMVEEEPPAAYPSMRP